MNNIKILSKNNKTRNNIINPRVIFSFEKKDYTIAELLTVFSADPIYLQMRFFRSHLPPVCHRTKITLRSNQGNFTYFKSLNNSYSHLY